MSISSECCGRRDVSIEDGEVNLCISGIPIYLLRHVQEEDCPLPLPTFHMVDGAPRPVATFSHASEVDGWVFLTGQMPTWPAEPDRALPEGIEAQTRRVMDNLILVLEGVSLSLENVVQARVYITQFDRDYESMNNVYKSYFAAGKLPARTCIGVTALAVGALVEIDCVARRG